GEITGVAIGPVKTDLSWDVDAGSCAYDVARGDLVALRAGGGDFRAAVLPAEMGCMEEDVASAMASDTDDPGSGEAYFYVVRGVDCASAAGTYDTSGLGQIASRDPGLQGPAGACTCEPGDDLDSDGFCAALDCDDDPGQCGGACFPTNPAADLCDGFDNDCDATLDEDPGCDDAAFCNGTETCVAGSCQAGPPPDCSFLDDQCNDGACNEGADACEAQPLPNNTPCSDGLFCTTTDSCQGGSCSSGPPRNCSFAGNQCNIGVCNEDDNSCDPSPANEGADCDDSDLCTTGETCTAGVCDGGVPAVISDDFTGSGAPPAEWAEINGSWAESLGMFGVDTSTDASLAYYADEAVCSPDHWVRVAYSDVGSANGVVLRQVSTDDTAVRYVVTYDESIGTVEWSYCTGSTPACTAIDDSGLGSFSLTNGDTLGVAVSGTGNGTVIDVWENPAGADPDAWGDPDWTSAVDPGAGNYADAGQHVGLFVGSAGALDRGSFDDFGAAKYDRVPTGPLIYGADNAVDALAYFDPVDGSSVTVGPFGYSTVTNIAFNTDTGVLYGYDESTDSLLTIDLATGAATPVGVLPMQGSNNWIQGMIYDPSQGLFLIAVSNLAFQPEFYGLVNAFATVDPVTAELTVIGSLPTRIDALGFDGMGQLWGIRGANRVLYTIDNMTGAAVSQGMVTGYTFPQDFAGVLPNGNLLTYNTGGDDSLWETDVVNRTSTLITNIDRDPTVDIAWDP
ncbi:MAG: hypothetical protein R3344_02945, partial [Acidobacteriota bacterium]|nr:hypothetical protein [Acidobacteriota bacterium]